MALLIWAIMIAAAITREAYLVHGDIGTASFYNPPYIPVSEGLWDNGAACGRRYRLRCLSGPNRPCKHRTIDVKVVDFCPLTPCPSTIMLSRDAFAAASSLSLNLTMMIDDMLQDLRNTIRSKFQLPPVYEEKYMRTH